MKKITILILSSYLALLMAYFPPADVSRHLLPVLYAVQTRQSVASPPTKDNNMAQHPPVMRQRPQNGKGVDDRPSQKTKLNDFGSDRLLGEINRAFQQRSLLSFLENESIAVSDKLEHIREATFSSDLLPNDKSFAPTALQKPSLYAAHLLDEWDF